MKTKQTAQNKASEPADKSSQVLERPIVDWPELLSSKTIDLQELESQLSSRIQRATLLEAYVSHRYNTGCGDQGHEKSAKVANKTLVKVRKALGFTYPDRTGISI